MNDCEVFLLPEGKFEVEDAVQSFGVHKIEGAPHPGKIITLSGHQYVIKRFVLTLSRVYVWEVKG